MRRAKLLPILATLAILAPASAEDAARAVVRTGDPHHGTAFRGRASGGLSPSPAPPGTRPVLVCFGDSLTAGAGIDPEQAYPARLQRLLDGEGYSYQVVNAGVNGNTTKDGVERITEVLQRHPQIVVVEFGGNDGLRGLPVVQAERNLDTMVREIKASGAKVVIAGITLPPQYGGPYIQSFNAMFPNVASRYHVPLLPFILQGVYGVPGSIQDDGIHPTAKGAEQVALNIEHLVQPLLKKGATVPANGR